MKERPARLITSDEATPATRQHKKPCSDCPFRRTSLKGWLGGMKPEFFTQFAHREGVYPCHTKDGAQCAGMAVFRANICKAPRNKEALVVGQDKRNVFAWDDEFLKHHGGTERG
jgi:hypothetical protein